MLIDDTKIQTVEEYGWNQLRLGKYAHLVLPGTLNSLT